MESFTVDPENQQLINQLLLKGKFVEAQQLLKKNMALVKNDTAEDVVETIGGLRSTEAKRLAEASQGKIVLRPDGKIDFPELGIKGMARLSVEGTTDFSDPENALVQGGYQGGGIRGISYMTGNRAMKEVATQGKKLFLASAAVEKTKALLATLGSNGAEQSKALQELFGSDFSGYWTPSNEEWYDVGSTSYVGVSEVSSDGYVRTVTFNLSDAHHHGIGKRFLQSFLACEDLNA